MSCPEVRFWSTSRIRSVFGLPVRVSQGHYPPQVVRVKRRYGWLQGLQRWLSRRTRKPRDVAQDLTVSAFPGSCSHACLHLAG